ncbi:MAG: Fur family transcriptional regulator [Candidatus Actinomarina sp.]|tara:strand:+ start:2963 stop:3373 length:411 start_codon:yes stop_codon:yes gene_type:complete
MDLISKLKKNGNRITESRITICKILEESGHEHFTADDLYKLALKKVKDIDLATVYRTLEILESLDIIEHSHQQHGSGIYYLKEYEKNTHIVCKVCNAIEDISVKVMESVEKIIEKNSMYKLTDNHFVYTGICNNCK